MDGRADAAGPRVRRASERVRSYGRQLVEEDDVAAVSAALRQDLLTTGPRLDALEAALVDLTGAADAVVVGNGTAALHLAALAVGIGPGHACVVPAISFVATANAARYVGAEVVFSDVDPETGLMRPEDLEAALARAGAPAPAAVFPVHLGGQCVDMDGIADLAAARNLAIVEDASHALGSVRLRPDGGTRPVGACEHGGLATFSMHPVKTIAMGEGGAVAVADRARGARLRALRGHGITREAGEFRHREAAFDGGGAPNPWYYEQTELGFNYRANELQCALGLSQMGKLARFVEARRTLRERYLARLAGLAPALRPVPARPWCRAAWHLMTVRIDFAALGRSRAEVMRALAAAGVGTQVHYIPIHRQPYYRERYGELRLPGAERYYEGCLSLPLHPGMVAEDVDAVAEILAGALGLAQEI